jgi:hypothetical protein
LKHFTTPKFWRCYHLLSAPIQELADKNFKLIKTNPTHPSLQFKKIGDYRSVRVGLSHRALAIEVPDGLLWFWIGNHSEYDKMIK